MPTAAKTAPQRNPSQRTRRRIAAVALLLGLVAVVSSAVYVGIRALHTMGSLKAAQGQLTAFKGAVVQSGAPSTARVYTNLQANTAKAAQQVDDPVWSLYEHVPLAGPNLKALRQTAVLMDDLVRNGIGPIAKAADGISIDSVKPTNGKVDIEPLRTLAPAVGNLDDAVKIADQRAKEIDTSGVVAQLKGPLGRLKAMLARYAPTIQTLREVMPVLYPALGGDGARHYLLIFQNNAEERASGGNPASMAMLVVDKGKISLGAQANSSDFPHPYAKPPYIPNGPRDRDWSRIYSDHTSTYVTNITMTPDFPTTAEMARAMWRAQFGGTVDGVISFDPVALSYLLQVTGPITLGDGKQIDAKNATWFLLNGVYFEHPEPKVQDAIFASAARAIFSVLTSGHGRPSDFLAPLRTTIEEQRLKMWSVRSDEEKLLMDSPLGTMLPEDNTEATVLGVYNNDDATSKMSYYMDERVVVTTNTCTATPKYTVQAEVINTLPASEARSLPQYVRANQARIVAGGDRQWVQVYGPVGAKLTSMAIDGKRVVFGTSLSSKLNTVPAATGQADNRPAVQGTMYDRPVGVVSINLGPASSVTVQAVFEGGNSPSKTVEVSHTPKVRDVPVDIRSANCG